MGEEMICDWVFMRIAQINTEEKKKLLFKTCDLCFPKMSAEKEKLWKLSLSAGHIKRAYVKQQFDANTKSSDQ